MLLKFNIQGSRINEVNREYISEGKRDFINAEFTFSPDWNGLSKEAYFAKGAEKYKIPLIEDKIQRDAHLDLNKGYWSVCVYGLDSGTMVHSTGICSVVIDRTLQRDGVIPPETPPSEIDLILQKSQSAENKANTAVETANTAMSTVDAKATEISGLITEYNTSKGDLLKAKEDAVLSASNAKTSENNAHTSETNAKASEANALQYKQDSEIAKGLAEQAVIDSADNVRLAEGHEQNAKNYATQAETAKTEAEALLSTKADKSYVDSTFTSAIKVTKSGTVISADDVSEIEHNVPTKVENINLFDITEFIGLPVNPTENDTFLNEKCFSYQSVTGGGIKEAFTNEFKENTQYTMSFDYAKDTAQAGFPFGFLYTDGTKAPIYLNGKPTEYQHKTITSVQGKTIKSIYIDNTGGSVWHIKNNVMLNKGTEALLYTPYISDLSQSKLNVMGSNLIDYRNNNQIGNIVELVENGYIYSPQDYTNRIVRFPVVIPKGDYLINFNSSNLDMPITIKYIGNEGEIKFINKDLLENVDFDISSVEIYAGPAGYGKTTTITNLKIVTNKSQNYEPPKEPTVYTPLADGTVEGVRSVSPTMTMLCDKEGLTINATYNADTKKYIDNKFNELQNAILSTGGNI